MLPILQDLLVKNVKRHLRQARKDGSDLQALDFLPTTYILPQVRLCHALIAMELPSPGPVSQGCCVMMCLICRLASGCWHGSKVCR